jgi:hypothetical protein
MQAIRVNNFLRLNPMHTGHHELDIVTDLVNHGITLMLPQTSSLLVEARLPTIRVCLSAVTLAPGST